MLGKKKNKNIEMSSNETTEMNNMSLFENEALKQLMDYFVSPTNTILSQLNEEKLTDEQFDEEIISRLNLFCSGKDEIAQNDEFKKNIINKFKKQITGYGFLDEYLNDDSISDIRLVNDKYFRITKRGKKETIKAPFSDRQDYIRYVRVIVAKNKVNTGRRNSIKRFCDAKSNEKAILRFSITTEVINANELPQLHIRKILKNKITLERLIEMGMLDKSTSEKLVEKVLASKGILFVGKGSAGKTTLMNALLPYIPHHKDVLVVQETDELHDNNHPGIHFQHIIDNNGESVVNYDLSDLLENGLTSDIDYIVVSEIKDKEAAMFLDAAYTGYQCWASLHAMSAEDGLDRLVDLALRDSSYTKKELTHMFRYIETIVFLKDFKIKEIAEAVGFDDELRRPIYKTTHYDNKAGE